VSGHEQARATRDDRAGNVGARHSLTSLHASGLHGLLLHHIHGRATAATPGTVAHHAPGIGEGLAIARELAAVGKRLACLLELGLLRWEAGLRGMRRRREAAERGLLAVEGLVIHGNEGD
jgi:hypothetical protein